jgi:hypothetical protein
MPKHPKTVLFIYRLTGVRSATTYDLIKLQQIDHWTECQNLRFG